MAIKLTQGATGKALINKPKSSTYKISPIETAKGKKPTTVAKPVAVTKPTIPTVAKPVDPNSYLTNDTTYQSQLAAINKALGDYQANEGASEGDYNAQYAQGSYDLSRANTQNMQSQADDYAGRGLYRSGLYGKAVGDANADYASKQSALDQSRQSYIGGLQRDQSNYMASQTLAQQQARQDAINRRTLALLSGTANS